MLLYDRNIITIARLLYYEEQYQVIRWTSEQFKLISITWYYNVNVSNRRNNIRRQEYSSRSSCPVFFYLRNLTLPLASNVTCNNITIHDGVLSPLLLELESLGISIKHVVDDLNDDKELDNLADSLKQKFVKEVRKMEEQGLFVNPGGG